MAVPQSRLDVGRRTAALQRFLGSLPGAAATPMAASRGSTPLVLMYKVAGKTFAILSVRAEEFVLLKNEPHRVEMLRQTYAGIGHRSHLDARHWIAVALDADVSAAAVKTLARQSYDLVAAGLTRKQQADLAALTTSGRRAPPRSSRRRTATE